MNVAAQFVVAHFRRLLDFLLEVGGRFRQFGISGYVELTVALDGRAAQAALPSLLVNPPAHGLRPPRAVGGDTVRNLESVRIELEYGDAAENIAVGIEELIVINVGMLAEDPLAIGAKIGLRGFALDPVAERVLTLVGVGEIELVREKEHTRDQRGDDQNRNDKTVKTDTGGLDCRDFVRPLQQSKGDQHRQQHAEGRGVVQKIRYYVQQVFADRKRRHLIPKYVAQQLEQGEYQQQHQESSDDHGEIERKVAQHIIVQDCREMNIEQASAPEQAERDALAKGREGRFTVRCQSQSWSPLAGRCGWEHRSLKPRNRALRRFEP